MHEANDALQQLKIIMDVDQIVLANTSPIYNVFLVILTLSKPRKSYLSQGKSIDKRSMYYSIKAFSRVLRGAGGRHV